ncbi:hypothetical protein BC936DRAFT_146921 [Jimgerdemannia flammicorona]|uniref:Centrosomin N-terminal motif 1 domain-containing protein n=1 Tax=Jimgerdemannia flammicorona TaxID=994334 RepID=A0A433D6M0_9FUNG|nr:hypothetical protein BC936DRAFT_146921 [Jimgerdemannia flammicorona]
MQQTHAYYPSHASTAPARILQPPTPTHSSPALVSHHDDSASHESLFSGDGSTRSEFTTPLRRIISISSGPSSAVSSHSSPYHHKSVSSSDLTGLRRRSSIGTLRNGSVSGVYSPSKIALDDLKKQNFDLKLALFQYEEAFSPSKDAALEEELVELKRLLNARTAELAAANEHIISLEDAFDRLATRRRAPRTTSVGTQTRPVIVREVQDAFDQDMAVADIYLMAENSASAVTISIERRDDEEEEEEEADEGTEDERRFEKEMRWLDEPRESPMLYHGSGMFPRDEIEQALAATARAEDMARAAEEADAQLRTLVTVKPHDLLRVMDFDEAVRGERGRFREGIPGVWAGPHLKEHQEYRADGGDQERAEAGTKRQQVDEICGAQYVDEDPARDTAVRTEGEVIRRQNAADQCFPSSTRVPSNQCCGQPYDVVIVDDDDEERNHTTTEAGVTTKDDTDASHVDVRRWAVLQTEKQNVLHNTSEPACREIGVGTSDNRGEDLGTDVNAKVRRPTVGVVVEDADIKKVKQDLEEFGVKQMRRMKGFFRDDKAIIPFSSSTPPTPISRSTDLSWPAVTPIPSRKSSSWTMTSGSFDDEESVHLSILCEGPTFDLEEAFEIADRSVFEEPEEFRGVGEVEDVGSVLDGLDQCGVEIEEGRWRSAGNAVEPPLLTSSPKQTSRPSATLGRSGSVRSRLAVARDGSGLPRGSTPEAMFMGIAAPRRMDSAERLGPSNWNAINGDESGKMDDLEQKTEKQEKTEKSRTWKGLNFGLGAKNKPSNSLANGRSNINTSSSTSSPSTPPRPPPSHQRNKSLPTVLPTPARSMLPRATTRHTRNASSVSSTSSRSTAVALVDHPRPGKPSSPTIQSSPSSVAGSLSARTSADISLNGSRSASNRSSPVERGTGTRIGSLKGRRQVAAQRASEELSERLRRLEIVGREGVKIDEAERVPAHVRSGLEGGIKMAKERRQGR